MDAGRTGAVEFAEFRKVLVDYKFGLGDDNIRVLFTAFDVDKNGTIDYEEFLRILRVLTLVKP